MGTKLPNFAKSQVHVLDKVINFATELVTKGSALAAADIFTGLSIPDKCLVLAAGINPIAAANASAATLDLGDNDADRYVDGFDATQIATDGVPILDTNVPKYYPAADTIDVTLATLTGTLSTGSVRVWAVVVDVSD